MKIDKLIRILQECVNDGFTEVELVASHPDSGHRNEYDIASIEYAGPIVYIHAGDD